MKRLILTIIALIMIVTGSTMLVRGQEINIDSSKIEINTGENSISVIESYSIDAKASQTISFWIQESPINLRILINNIEVEYYTTLLIGDNRYFCNISGLNVTTDTNIQTSYLLDVDTTEFEKTLQYNTTLISITFDGKEIFAGNDLKAGSLLTVELQKTIQTQIETIPTWIYIVMVLLAVLLIASLAIKTKIKSTTKKENISASEELLDTKKSLLMETLKDIEKKHRAKEISDDTYHKLREQYKQQAVETMKKLEDTKSKIK